MRENRSAGKTYHHILIAGLLFIVGGILSIYLWIEQSRNEREIAHQKFLQQVQILQKGLQQNLYTYGQLVNDVTGVFNASETVTQKEWNAYVQTVRKLSRQYPGIVGLGFSISEPQTERVLFYSGWDKNNRDDLTGLNLLSYKNRKIAIETSNKTGTTALANQLRLIRNGVASQDTPYFGLFAPVYKKDDKNLYGHVFLEVDFYAMVARLFNGEDKGVKLKIAYKNDEGVDEVLYEAKEEMEDKKSNVQSDSQEQLKNNLSKSPLFSHFSTITFNKSTWNLYFYSTPVIDDQVNKKGPAVVFFSCIIISFLGAIVVWSLNAIKERSQLLYLSNQKIRSLNKGLELKVKDRTQALEKLNHLLEKNNKMMSLQNELLTLMQGCSSVKEVFVLSGEFFKRMFPHHGGRLYCYNRQTFGLDLVTSWGEDQGNAPKIIKVSDCFSLHYLHPYEVKVAKSEMICGHVLQEAKKTPYFCIPFVQNESIFGLLTLWSDLEAQEGMKRFVEHIEKSISLTCLNLDLKRQLQYDAIHDPLTGLYNRRYFEENLLREMMKSRRAPVVFNILMIDVDNFKQINDKYGHQMGDEVLKTISNVLKHDIRVTDLACRFGGEEFVIMLQTSVEYGYKRAEQFIKKISELKITFGDQTLTNVTISVGLSAYPKHGDTMDKLIKSADEALYRAKSLGKNQVVTVDELGNSQKPEHPFTDK